MGPIIDTPKTIRDFYRDIQSEYADNKAKNEEEIEKLSIIKESAYEYLTENIDIFPTYFNVDIAKEKEFKNDVYTNGSIYRLSKLIYDSSENKPTNAKFAALTLVKYANATKKIKELQDKNKFLDKILNLSFKEYSKYMFIYFTEVQKQLILEGNAYNLGNCLGKICINRCRLENPRPKIDFAATKKNKAKLLAEGKELYDKEKADYYAKFNIPYNGIDYRVYCNVEAVYEIAYFGVHTEGGRDYEFNTLAHRGTKIRQFSNKDLAEMYGKDINDIFDIDVDLKAKLAICLDINPNLYLKYIRNEQQTPLVDGRINRKD